MDILQQLIDAYLDNSFEDLYYLNTLSGEVIFETDPGVSGEPGIEGSEVC